MPSFAMKVEKCRVGSERDRVIGASGDLVIGTAKAYR
jgi:hypothetical protein